MTRSRTPLLSVVVPFFNVAPYIQECLDSVRLQDMTDLEVVCVDDGSTDESLHIAEQVAATDDRFRIVRQPNGGLGPARNTGTAAATGKYITYVDSDDIVAPHAYARLVGSLEQTGSVIAAGNARRFRTLATAEQSWTHREPFRVERIGTSIHKHPALVQDRMVWNKVYARSLVDRLGIPFPAIHYEDYPFTLPAYLAADRVDVLPDTVYYWRIRDSGDSITQQLAHLDNLTDRVRSAHMVLDEVLVGNATSEIRSRLTTYLMTIDLVAIAGALALVPPRSREAVGAMGRALATRLDADHQFRVNPVAGLIHAAFLDGDLDFAQALGSAPSTDATTLLRRTATTAPSKLPTVLRTLPRVKVEMLPSRFDLLSASWSDDGLDITVTASLRDDLAKVASVTTHLPGAHRGTRVRSSVGPDGFECRLHVPFAALDALNTGEEFLPQLVVRAGGKRRTAVIRFYPELLPGSVVRPDGTVIQVGDGADHPAVLTIARADPSTPVCHVTEHDGLWTFRLQPSLPHDLQLAVRRPAPARSPIVGHGTQFTVSPVDLINGDEPAAPTHGVGDRLLLAHTPHPDQDTEIATSANHKVLLGTAPPPISTAGHRIWLTTNYDGVAIVQWRPDQAETGLG